MGQIVVLDDDEGIGQLLRTVLAEAGHAPLVAGSLEGIPVGTQADLVVTDLLPVQAYRREGAKSWIEVLRRRFRAPIVIVTAHIAAVREPDALGADAIVAKPFDVEALLATIEERLATGVQRRPSVTS